MVGYAATGLSPGVHRGLPSDSLVMVFSIDEPVHTAATFHDWLQGRHHSQWTVLGGLHTTAAWVDQPGRWRGIQVALHPLGARRLFGLPAAALPVTSWDARELLGSQLEEVHANLAAATSWSARYAVVTEFLTARLATEQGGVVRPEVTEAWRCLARGRGRARVAELAHHVGYSRRRLTDVFRAETGLSPKTAARLMRFDAARRAVALRSALGRPLDIAEIAVDNGYYDHAHLVREFTEFAGLGPTLWLREEFPNVQAGAAAQASG
ncbi:MAG TPA: helix-turn-helix domain-containing protein [Ornithinimicrobium sp.]|uniref:helix-turn-helix domain-containing protein n=1 Tax=Ornithinimicrobium sp. TaxID=1977084 RepID=UPI002B47A178|nr:helix-turn-helix domain-containing protein [Ornithinimicrobium sp.]HKJ11018.1 helix-turn-helix domain-containing protein [Ornithinimicrobium sp.]